MIRLLIAAALVVAFAASAFAGPYGFPTTCYSNRLLNGNVITTCN